MNGNLSTNAGGATSVGVTTLTGGLTTTSVGDITQTGAITTGAPSSITSSTGDIDLSNPNNSFFGATSLTATVGDIGFAGSVNGNLTTNAGGTTSFGVTTLTGGLNTTSVGDITQTGAITTGAASSITSSTGDITLNNAGNSFFGATSLTATVGDISFAGSVNGNLTTNAGGATSFGVTTLTGGLTTTSVGDITQTGAITTGAASSITSTTGDITLTNPGNRFTGATSLTATVGDITFGGTVNGNLSTNAGGATSFAATTVNGNLGVLSGGDITQTGPLIVTGTSSLVSTIGDIVLTNPANRFGGQVTASGGDISLTATGNLNVGFTSTGVTTLNNTGNLTVSGSGVDLNVTTLGNAAVGNLALSGNLNMNVQGSASIITGASATVGGTATLVSPLSVLQQNGTSLGFADKPRVSGAGGGVGDFVLGATRFNPSSFSSTNNTSLDTGLASGQLASVRGAGIAGFEGVVPKGYVVSRPDAPAPESTARGYHTGDESGIKGGAFRVIYPKVNLGQAYYVGAPRGDDASVEEAEAK